MPITVSIAVFIAIIIIMTIAIAGISVHILADRDAADSATVLDSLTCICDGRSLTIGRSELWEDDMCATVYADSQLRQVFRIIVPDHAPITHHHPATRVTGSEITISLPEDFDRSFTARPFTPRKWLTTTDQVRTDELPLIAASMNLDQAAIDAATVELVGHELRYVITYDHRLRYTDWVDYQPVSS